MNVDLKYVIDNYSELVSKIAMFALKNNSDIDDVIQEVYLKVSDNLYKINDEEHLKNWLVVTTRNISYNYNKKFWRKRECELFEKYYIANKSFIDEILSIKSKVKDLSDEYRETYDLYAQGYKYKEMSKKLKIREDAVRKRIERIREIIKVDIFEEGEW